MSTGMHFLKMQMVSINIYTFFHFAFYSSLKYAYLLQNRIGSSHYTYVKNTWEQRQENGVNS